MTLLNDIQTLGLSGAWRKTINNQIGITGCTGYIGQIGNTGPTGAQGPAGESSEAGCTGPTGANGNVGPTGALGNPGVSAGPGETGSTGPVGLGGMGYTGPTGPVGTSNFKEYGCAQIEENGWPGFGFEFSFTTSFTEFLPANITWLITTSSLFSNPSNGRLQYDGTETKFFLIHATFNTSFVANYAICILKNGSVLTDTENYSFGRYVSISTIIQLEESDYVAIGARALSATNQNICSGFISAVMIP